MLGMLLRVPFQIATHWCVAAINHPRHVVKWSRISDSSSSSGECIISHTDETPTVELLSLRAVLEPRGCTLYWCPHHRIAKPPIPCSTSSICVLQPLETNTFCSTFQVISSLSVLTREPWIHKFGPQWHARRALEPLEFAEA